MSKSANSGSKCLAYFVETGGTQIWLKERTKEAYHLKDTNMIPGCLMMELENMAPHPVSRAVCDSCLEMMAPNNSSMSLDHPLKQHPSMDIHGLLQTNPSICCWFHFQSCAPNGSPSTATRPTPSVRSVQAHPVVAVRIWIHPR